MGLGHNMVDAAPKLPPNIIAFDQQLKPDALIEMWGRVRGNWLPCRV